MQPVFGSFLPGVAAFDASAFGLSDAEALLMDPQQRQLLEAYAQAQSGQQQHHPAAAASTGVYIGISAVDYNKLTAKLRMSPTPYSATGSLSLSVAAGRLSYSFGLKGPALAIDTACSSALVAVHAAVSGLRLAHSQAAAVGGVNLQLIPDTPAIFHKAGAVLWEMHALWFAGRQLQTVTRRRLNYTLTLCGLGNLQACCPLRAAARRLTQRQTATSGQRQLGSCCCSQPRPSSQAGSCWQCWQAQQSTRTAAAAA
jgi:hypothetical protein